jgi:hypothetical protein
VTNPDGTSGLLVRIRAFEEKGSDVNVGTHLMHDVLSGQVDAVIVVSNDSDLALPVRIARQHVPVGLLNPSQKPLATRLPAVDRLGQTQLRHQAVHRSKATVWVASTLPPTS